MEVHGMVTYFFSDLSVTGMTETMQNLTKIMDGIVLYTHSAVRHTLMCVCPAVFPTNLHVHCNFFGSLSHDYACIICPINLHVFYSVSHSFTCVLLPFPLLCMHTAIYPSNLHVFCSPCHCCACIQQPFPLMYMHAYCGLSC